MQEKTYQILGMVGFIIAGVLFVLTGLKSGDMLTVAGSIVWTVSCILMLIPLVRPHD